MNPNLCLECDGKGFVIGNGEEQWVCSECDGTGEIELDEMDKPDEC